MLVFKGKRSSDQTNYETTNLQPPQSITAAIPSYHQLPPVDLSAESIRKEAALVLAQAERHKSIAENADNIPTFRVRTKRSGDPKKFHSLPTRKKRKPLARSSSDAAAKKAAKKPSIFSIFNRKSDTQINQDERDARFEGSGGRRLVRSKSDVSSLPNKPKKPNLKDSKTTQNQSAHKTVTSQLTPIIENVSNEDFFEEQIGKRERRKSDAITDREKNDSALNISLDNSLTQNILDDKLLGKIPISDGIREKILTLQTKSQENMHSSQLPPQKLPLTKGKTVNGLAKRLSMERFSPPPPLTGPAFSYIRPNDGITYAQLEHEDHDLRLGQRTLQKNRDYRRDYRSPSRERFTPDRELHKTLGNRKSLDQTDFITSQNHKISHRSKQHSPNYNPHSGTTTIHIGGSFSPSPWQPLSPRNLSDEDEGLGIETRKYYDDDLPKMRSKSPAEPPIVPKIRSITPTQENGFHTPERYLSPRREMTPPRHHDDMGYRRARLESRILNRRFGEVGGFHNARERTPNHHLQQEDREETTYEQVAKRYLSPERDILKEQRFHKPEVDEILNKYSPERSHLDIIAPTPANPSISTLPKLEKTSRYKHTKYYDDGHGGVKEVYERQTQIDADGTPYVRESRHRERLNSYGNKVVRESSPTNERHSQNDYEPKSLDSQFTGTDQYRSSPENMKRYDINSERVITPHQSSEDRWHSSLKRDKLQQRSFDKGDSGIENDFRKESFNGDLQTRYYRWRKPSTADDMRSCENFLKKERRHCEQQRQQSKEAIVYRERSIDDGSHYDPHLDKFPMSRTTLRRRDQPTQTIPEHEQTTVTTLKRSKKLGGFEKVKQLFTGAHGDKKDPERKSNSSSTSSSAGTQQTVRPKDKDSKYMVNEEEMRLRYQEHRAAGNALNLPSEHKRELKGIDISMRRRLSTPKASPLLIKRTSSPIDKTHKESSLASKPEKISWFKSLDRRSKSKSKEKINVTVNEQNETPSSSMKRAKPSTRQQAPNNTTVTAQPAKNLRFFGDTDVDSNPPTISKANTGHKSRPAVTAALNRSQKFSQSAYHLDRIAGAEGSPQRQDYRQDLATASLAKNSVAGSRLKSTSMHNLENGHCDEVDFRKKRHYSRSRELHDISESGSETEDQNNKRPNGGLTGSKTLSRDRLDRTHRYDDHTYRRSNERHALATTTSSSAANGNGDTTTGNQQHQSGRNMPPYLAGPPKPARSTERRAMSYSRERERFPAESSGTEGESSLHSQRSVVYLHATTVGAIPQPYHLRRRSISKDDLQSNKTKSQPQALQPMTRTVSRSVSMLAPWKPKLISEGYEINYSQEQKKAMTTLPRHSTQPTNSNVGNTVTRSNKRHDPGRTRRQDIIKDDESSLRNSSTTSASKSALSTNLRRKLK
uniref:Uncharacterized protein n=1 Tax=Glossina morsitans morsitans TaxID=37546 RepID=A0A1B0FJR8_GLOMM